MSTIYCCCGWSREGVESLATAEIVADVHESQFIGRRAHRHDTRIEEARS